MTRPVFFLSALLIAGCNVISGHQGAIPAEKFALIYADLLETGQRGRQWGWDRTRCQSAADSVLAKEGCTRDGFNATVRLLNENVTGWKKICEDATRIIEERAGGPAALR
jgi:hypothetical protein